MYLDERDVHCCQRIADRDTGVGEGCRIDDDEVRVLGTRLLHTIHQRCFGVALEVSQFCALRLG